MVFVAAAGEIIFKESCIFSVNIIPQLFYALSSITDAETRLKFNTSLNKTQKFGTLSFVSTSNFISFISRGVTKLPVLFR